MPNLEALESESGPLFNALGAGERDASNLPVLYKNTLPIKSEGMVTQTITKNLDVIPIPSKGKGFIGWFRSRSRFTKGAMITAGGLGIIGGGAALYEHFFGRHDTNTDLTPEVDLGVNSVDPTPGAELSTNEFLRRAIAYLSSLLNENSLPSAKKENLAGFLSNFFLFLHSQPSSSLFSYGLTAVRVNSVLSQYGWVPEYWDSPNLMVSAIDRMSEEIGESMDMEGVIMIINNLRSLNIEEV